MDRDRQVDLQTWPANAVARVLAGANASALQTTHVAGLRILGKAWARRLPVCEGSPWCSSIGLEISLQLALGLVVSNSGTGGGSEDEARNKDFRSDACVEFAITACAWRWLW